MMEDFQAANAMAVGQLGALASLCLDFVTQRDADGFEASLGAFGDREGLDVDELRNRATGMLRYFTAAMRETLSPPQVRQDCGVLGMDEEHAAALSEVWGRRSSQISRALLARTVMANELVDMDWKFGVTASTDEAAEVGSTFLQLKLVVDRGNDERRDVFMELTVQQFYQFLAEMEKASSILDMMADE